MGCCQSRLLSQESTDIKYQINPNSVEESNMVEKKNLALVGLDKQNQNIDKNSLCTLRQKLSQALSQFQRDRGIISLAQLSKRNPQTSNQNKLNQHIPESPSITQKIEQAEITNPFESNSNTMSGSQNSSFIQYQRSHILSINSLQEDILLEKQLFYINSNKIDGAPFLKWTEENRKPVRTNKSTLLIKKILKKQINFYVSLYLIASYEEVNHISLFCYKNVNHGIGYRIFANGTKRMLLIKNQQHQLSSFRTKSTPQIDFQNSNQFYLSKTVTGSVWKLPKFLPMMQNCQLSFSIFMLTGWIPQIINFLTLEQSNLKEVFSRLIINYQNKNIIATFTDLLGSSIFILTFASQKVEQWKGIKIKIHAAEEYCQVSEEMSYNIKQIIDQCPLAHINWNPQIYTFAKKLEGIYQCRPHKAPKYRLKIPACQSQVQIRLMIQPHISTSEMKKPLKFTVSLYETKSQIKIQQKCIPTRQSTNSSSYFLSELFIFQKCEEISEYVIIIDFQDQNELQQLQITVDFFAFFPIWVEKLEQPMLKLSRSIVSELRPQNCGFGMNSPFFSKNLQYSLSVTNISRCIIKLETTHSIEPSALSKNSFMFELCVLPDNFKQKDLSLVRPAELVNQIIHSEQFQNYGVFQFSPKWNNSIVVVVGLLPAAGTIHIQIEGYQTRAQEEAQEAKMEIQQIIFQPSFQQQFEFYWKQDNPGPRKRTTSNSQPIFYPCKTFQKFLQNPYVDLQLAASTYQFSLLSRSFNEKFCQSYELLLENNEEYIKKVLKANPPNIALSIYKLNEAKTEMKILLDDFQYVPYGIGFWTTKFKMNGIYRFVFSKIENSFEEGLFRVRKF